MHVDATETYRYEVDAGVGEKVILQCTSPRDDPASVTWSYQSFSDHTDDLVDILRIQKDKITQPKWSGRISLKSDGTRSFSLAIYGLLQSDSGTYSCSVDVGYEQQHVTVLSVTGIGLRITQWCFLLSVPLLQHSMGHVIKSLAFMSLSVCTM